MNFIKNIYIYFFPVRSTLKDLCGICPFAINIYYYSGKILFDIQYYVITQYIQLFLVYFYDVSGSCKCGD